MHIHGHSFQVIDMGSLDQLESGQTAFTNATHAPVMKDTVAVQRGGFVRVRFRANPGYWIFHCTFEHQLCAGMAIVLKVGDRKEMPTSPPGLPTCGNYLEPFAGHAVALSSLSFMQLICIACFLVFILKENRKYSK